MILFRTTEHLVSKAPWYAPSTRAQVVAHASAKLSLMAEQASDGGRLDYLKVWSRQAAGEVLERQLLVIGEAVMDVLLTPPQVGQHVGEWAKQQACRKRIFDMDLPAVPGFESFLVDRSEVDSEASEQRAEQRVTDGLAAVTEVIERGGPYWENIRRIARAEGLLSPADDAALAIAEMAPRKLPSEAQATRAVAIRQRCAEAGLLEPA
jgi:hypothetical protein